MASRASLIHMRPGGPSGLAGGMSGRNATNPVSASMSAPMLEPTSFSRAICIGACTIDRFGTTIDAKARLHTSNIGRLRTGFGGAARNVASNLARLGVPVMLASAVGQDPEGDAVLATTSEAGVDVSASIRVPGQRTASYTAIFDGSGELVIGLADMGILDELKPRLLEPALRCWTPATLVFADANLAPQALAAVVAARKGPLALAAVSVQKSARIRPFLQEADCLFLNRIEAGALVGDAGLEDLAARLAGRGAPRGVVTAGAEGAIAWNGTAVLRLAAPRARPINVNGAGDALAAAVLARLHAGDAFFTACERAMAAAALAVEAEETVRADLTMAMLLARATKEDA
jgi:pseudouridine kinase